MIQLGDVFESQVEGYRSVGQTHQVKIPVL